MLSARRHELARPVLSGFWYFSDVGTFGVGFREMSTIGILVYYP